MSDNATPKRTVMSRQIFDAIQESCTLIVENMPESQEYIARRNELMQEIKTKVSRQVHNDISDLYMNYAVHFGAEMFLLGVTLGRDPGIIFDLPDVY